MSEVMDVRVKELIDKLIEREGGYVNNPKDRGGPTKYGITHKTLARWLQVKSVSAEDVRNLTYNEAFQIYADTYYGKPKLELLPDDLEPVIFDTGVMSGPTKAVELLQEVLVRFGARIRVDGILGPKTVDAAITACEEHDTAYIINAYVDARIDLYHNIVLNDPSQAVFLKGWVNRAKEFEVERDRKVTELKPKPRPTEVATDTVKKVGVGTAISGGATAISALAGLPVPVAITLIVCSFIGVTVYLFFNAKKKEKEG